MSQSVGSELKLLSRHSSIYGLSNVLNRIVSFILLPLYTHYLSPADYGVMDLLYFTTAFVGIVLDMGINSAVSRFYFDSDDQTRRNRVVTSAFYGFGIGSTIIILLLISGSKFMTELIFDDDLYSDDSCLGRSRAGYVC
jgi:O-antigen/teichoic acid export membrane protein